jgi:hypothetical protein
MTISNQERAARCQQALTAYSDDYDAQTNLVDFLADAMHWCRANALDFDALLQTATHHYQTEIIEETGVLP